MQKKKLLKTLKADYFQQKKQKQQQQKKKDKITTREPTPELSKQPTKHRKSKLKLKKESMNKIIADKKYVNVEIFWNYFKCQNPSLLAKILIRANQVKMSN